MVMTTRRSQTPTTTVQRKTRPKVEQVDDDLVTAINRASHEARMVADWVEDCVGSSDYILLPTPQSPETFSIFQLLNIQPKIELVPTFRDHGSKQQLWNVQPVQVLHQDILPLNAQSMETFILGEPTRFDFLQYVSDQNPLRDQFKIYETRTSDFEGGLTAHTPRNLVPIANLNSPKVSVLALTDALEALDYVGVARKVSHWPKGGKFFDSRNLHGQRKYLQCVLSSTWFSVKAKNSSTLAVLKHITQQCLHIQVKSIQNLRPSSAVNFSLWVTARLLCHRHLPKLWLRFGQLCWTLMATRARRHCLRSPRHHSPWETLTMTRVM